MNMNLHTVSFCEVRIRDRVQGLGSDVELRYRGLTSTVCVVTSGVFFLILNLTLKFLALQTGQENNEIGQFIAGCFGFCMFISLSCLKWSEMLPQTTKARSRFTLSKQGNANIY